jgi:hypothetical protein
LCIILLKNGRTRVCATRASAPKTTVIGTGSVTCRARLGGVLQFYDREAA